MASARIVGRVCEICGMCTDDIHEDRCQEHRRKEPMKANEVQVGGKHYQHGGEQHWDRIWRLYGRGYFVGCATKYIERYHLKNGIEDLKKARHFLDKLIELEQEEITKKSSELPNPYTEGGAYVEGRTVPAQWVE